MKNTLNKVMNNLLTEEEIQEVNAEAKEEITRIRGGKRAGSGRKAVVQGKILKFTKRLTDEEAQFIDYARAHHLSYKDLMQG